MKECLNYRCNVRLSVRRSPSDSLNKGATSGIGEAIAIRLAQQGCNIAINYRSYPEAAADTEEMALQRAWVNIENCGISQESDIVEMVNTLVKEFGSVDILVNNAGIQTESPSGQSYHSRL